MRGESSSSGLVVIAEKALDPEPVALRAAVAARGEEEGRVEDGLPVACDAGGVEQT
jgi:hypothetical protein